MRVIHAVLFAACALCFSLPIEAGARCAANDASKEIKFSPEDDAEGLVLKVIHSASRSVRVAAYSFTSPAIVKALIAAKRRGIDVAVVVDYRHNLEDNADRSRAKAAARSALDLLVRAGIPARTIAVFPVAHDKVIISDSCHVQTGSFNYSQQARRNSENVIVLWNDEQAAAAYLRHWNNRFSQGIEYRSSY